MKCPLCGKDMSGLSENRQKSGAESAPSERELIYFCEKHGVMNKSTDLKDKVDQIAKKA